MKSDPQEDETCYNCSGTGKVPCEDFCEKCIHNGDCSAQEDKLHIRECEICGGSGEVEGWVGKRHRRELRDDFERRWEAERDEKLPDKI